MAERDVGNLRTRLSWEDDGANRSLEGFKRDLRGLRSEMNLAKSGGKEYTNSLKGMREQSDILTRQFKTQEQKVKELRHRYEESARAKGEDNEQTKRLASQYNNAQAQMNRTEEQLKRLNAEIKRQESPWTQLGEKMDTTGRKMQTVGRGMTSTGRKLTTRVTAPILGLAAGALKVGMDFEEGMSKVQAISGATGDNLVELEEMAREMGATTRFSATEAADGMSYLAMAGFEVEEIMDTMPGLLDLAASANMDLGRAADIASNIISGFGMEAKEAGRVSDVLAASAANANTDVEQMGDAMSYVAPVAQGAGLSLEETAAAIGTLSDSGIQGQRAGTALRKTISSLQNPTGQAAKALEDMGLSMEDVDPSAHSLSEILKVLEDAGMDSSQAMQLVGEQAGPGLIALLEEGSGGLSDFTEDMENSEGAAKEMAETMEDNAKGAMREFKSALEEAGISLSEQMLPAVTEMVESGTELVRKFGELDDSTKQNIIRFAGLAAAAGPAAVVVGNVTTATGGLLRVGGSLAKTLGAAGTKGTTLGAMSGLTKAGVAGLAIAGVAGVAYGIKKLNDKSKEAKEVNLETTESLNDQAVALEESVDIFDSLSEKASISNAELAELNDLNERISESSNPGEIKELQEQYDALAKKSGLSKEEIAELFEANELIVEQSSDVETSISNQGNKFVESTDAVKEYVNELYEMSRMELDLEREKQLEREKELRKELTEQQQEQAKLEREANYLLEAKNMSQDEIFDRQEEINELYYDENTSQEEKAELMREHGALQDALTGDVGKEYEKRLESLEAQREKIEGTEEELEKIEELDNEMANIVLKQAGINEEGEKGLEQLDKTIEKNREEIEKLEEKKSKNGELNESDAERLENLRKQVDKQEESRLKIFEETGLYNDLNTLVDEHVDQLKGKNKKELDSLSTKSDIKLEDGRIIEQIKEQNSEYDKQIKKLEDEKKQNGDVNGELQDQINKLKDKKERNVDVGKEVLKELGLWDDVKDSIQQGSDNVKTQNSHIRTGTGNLENQGAQIDLNNTFTKYGIEYEKDRTTEAGRSVDKDVTVLPSYDPFDLSKDLSKKDTKNVDLTLNPLNKKFSVPIFESYAHGTSRKGHPGGLAKVNDGVGSNAGRELIRTPDGKTGMFKGKNVFADLPKGTHVMSARDTRKLIPRYADGTDWRAEFGFKGIKPGLDKFLTGGFVDSTFTKFGEGAAKFVRGNLTNKISMLFGDIGGNVAKSAGKWAAEIRRAAAQMGQKISGAEVSGIISQINRESGGNPKITQSSAVYDINIAQGNPARGLLQYIPQTFSAYKVPGFDNIYSGYHQLLAFFNNKNWRKDLPYGKRGWGPTGGRRYAMGTNNHPGGAFLAGEKGWELGRLGDHWEVLNHGIYDRPRGYEVYSHRESKKIMNAINGMPGYANGTRNTSKNTGQSQGGGDIHQTINVYSPDPTSPADNARKMKQASRQLAMEWR